VSLIHEALRKARREAARAEDPGVVYPGGLTGRRPRRSWAFGFAVGALLSLAAGIALVAIFRVVANDRSTGANADAVMLQAHDSPQRSMSPSVPDRELRQQPTPTVPEKSAVDTEAMPPRQAPAPAVGDGVSPRAEARPPAGQTLTFTTPTPAPQTGLREYVVDADLGHATLTLDYIVFRSEDPFAQINGLDVRVGSTIEGCTVEEITAEWVRLRDPRGPLVLRAE
jgi:hypothetical protein